MSDCCTPDTFDPPQPVVAEPLLETVITTRRIAYATHFQIQHGLPPSEELGAPPSLFRRAENHTVTRTDMSHSGENVGYHGKSFSVDLYAHNVSLDDARRRLQAALADLERLAT